MTAIGLVFAVLTERIVWSVAFKTAVFMPMAISASRPGSRGGSCTSRIRSGSGQRRHRSGQGRRRSTRRALGGCAVDRHRGRHARGGLTSEPVEPGAVVPLGLTQISADEVPDDSEQAVLPEALSGGITGVVWRDFKPGGGAPGEVESEEVGLPA